MMRSPLLTSSSPPPAPEVRNVARAIIQSASEILLAYAVTKRFHFLPGGQIEPGEPLRAALERELREEITLSTALLDEGTYVGLFEHAWDDGALSIHEFNHLWLFQLEEPAGRHPIESCESHLSFSWVPLRCLTTVGLRPEPLAHALTAWLHDDRSTPLFGSTIKN
jgi:8-oxo-dGTP diphosphatase